MVRVGCYAVLTEIQLTPVNNFVTGVAVRVVLSWEKGLGPFAPVISH